MSRTVEATPVIRRDMDVRVEAEMCMAATLPIPKREREAAGGNTTNGTWTRRITGRSFITTTQAEEVRVKLSKGSKRLFAGVSAIAAMAAGGVVLVSASASADANADATHPLVQDEDGAFYREIQIDAVWAMTVSGWPEELPKGAVFPETAPAFFHPGDGQDHLFHEALPSLIAARYWRCAWIDEALQGSATANAQLEKYPGLPGVQEFVDVETYKVDFATYARTVGQSPLAAEFDVECGLYSAPEGEK